MEHTTPSVSTIAATVRSQIQAQIGGTVPLLPKAVITVLSWVIGGLYVLLHRYIAWGILQQFVAYASTSEVEVSGRKLIPLVEWGRLLGVGDPLAASRAIFDVAVNVTTQTGTLPAGALMSRSSTGVVYQTISLVSLNAPTVTARVRAISDQSGGDGSGTIANLTYGDKLAFASPLPNVSRETTITAVVATAEDAETWDAYRKRVMERARSKPQGGASADYQAWAREVPGIVAAYPYTSETPGVVDVYVEASPASSGSADGIPTVPQREAVATAINFDPGGVANRRPVNAALSVLPISRQTFDVVVQALDAPDGTQEEIETALADYYREREPFIVGLSVYPRKDRVLLTSVVGIVDAIVLARGGTVATITQLVGGLDAAVYGLAHGEKAKLGTVTFTE